MTKYNNDVIRIIQLTVLSALVDGSASPEEVDVIAAGAAEYFQVEVQAAKSLASKMVASHTNKKLLSNPVAVIQKAKNAMRRLSGRHRKIALAIATKVAAATPGGEASETRFLRQIEQMAKA